MNKRVHETGQYALLQSLSVLYVRDHGGRVELTKPEVDALQGLALSVRYDAVADKVIVTAERQGGGAL